MKKIILTIMLAAWAFGAWAQPRTLTLDDCRALAVANNAGVKIAEGKAQAATELKREAFTKYFPTIQAQAIGFRSNTEVFKYDVGNLFTLGLVKKGGSMNVTAVQPVFAGGRIANGNKLAKVGVAVADLEHEGAIDNALLTVEQYYWQIATLQSKKRTLQSVIQMLDTLDRQISVAVEAGVANRNDLLKVQLQRNNMLSLMVDLDNGIALSSNLLAQYVGLDGEEVAIVDDAPPAEVPVLPADLYLDPSQALGSTVDYRLLEQSVRAADLEKDIAVG
ncbi:MAG: TolC family protein, partial [Muribaculaceae bacterium]|nr:TolC family protein [Muribaculaceae bacterium]